MIMALGLILITSNQRLNGSPMVGVMLSSIIMSKLLLEVSQYRWQQLGSEEKAKLHAAEVLRLTPDFSVIEFLQCLPFQESRDREHHREGLRKAGLPE